MLENITTQLDWPLIQQQFVRILAAVLLGGLIGLEREFRDKSAGFRTIILICVGACIFSIISQVIGGPDWNSTRIAAQIVSGIGFLGAGAILYDRTTVLGLTTAATIWAVAAIGMAVGFGQLALGVLGTVTILIALFVFDLIEKWIGNRRDLQTYNILANNIKNMPNRIDELFTLHRLRTRKRTFYEDGDNLIFQVIAMGSKKNHDRLRSDIAMSDEFRLRKY